jgi:hypothetical protein
MNMAKKRHTNKKNACHTYASKLQAQWKIKVLLANRKNNQHKDTNRTDKIPSAAAAAAAESALHRKA